MKTVDRAALSAHQTKTTAAGAQCDELNRPVFEIGDRITAETAGLRNAECARGALAEAEREDAIDCGRNGTPASFVAEIAVADAEVARRQRVIAALQAKAAEVEAPLRDAQLSASILASATEGLVANVIAGEVVDNVLAEYFDAQRKLAAAEAKCRTLAGECMRRKWMALAEKVHTKLHTTPPARWQVPGLAGLHCRAVGRR